jgi:hypothetical protein
MVTFNKFKIFMKQMKSHGYIMLTLWIAIMLVVFVPSASAEVNSIGTIKQSECIQIPQVCASCSYVNVSVQYPNKSIAISNQAMTPNGAGLWIYNFCNTSQLGRYDVSGMGDINGVDTGFSVLWFEVTPNGESITTGKALFYIGLISILIIFLVLSMTSFVRFENLLNRVSMIGLSYLLLIAITFVGWNMAKDFVTSSPFIIEMLWIIFLVLMIGAFPLLIGAFAWYVMMLFKIKEIQDLMNKGFSFDDAETRVKNRRKRR